MNKQRVFKVALHGFSKPDALTIHRIIKLTDHRVRRYQLTSDNHFDILLINGVLVQPDQVKHQAPCVWLGGAPADHDYYMDRPILSSRLLRLLDKITVSVYKYLPEIEVGVNTVNVRESLATEGQTQWQFDQEQKDDGYTVREYESDRRVLVVDDSQVVRTQLKLILDNLGIVCDMAKDGVEAIKLLQNCRYDLILMDVIMPNMDGLEATKKIKKELEGQGPVILLTAKTSQLDRLRGAFAGCDTYLTKPINQQELLDVIKPYIEEKATDADPATL